MQECIVLLILAIAIGIIWKHMAPTTLRLFFNQTLEQIAAKTGFSRISEKLAKKQIAISDNAGCATCSGCEKSSPPLGCEIRIRPQDIKKR